MSPTAGDMHLILAVAASYGKISSAATDRWKQRDDIAGVEVCLEPAEMDDIPAVDEDLHRRMELSVFIAYCGGE